MFHSVLPLQEQWKSSVYRPIDAIHLHCVRCPWASGHFQLIELPVVMEPAEVHHWHHKGPLLVSFKATHIFTRNFLRRMPSSGTWRHVDLVWTDVSKERIASIFRVEKPVSEEPAWAGGCIVPRFGSEGLKKTTDNFSCLCQSPCLYSYRRS
jgi:hypothetical protein